MSDRTANISWRRAGACCLPFLFIVLAWLVASPPADAAKPGSGSNAVLSFGDASGDAIASDGLGSYPATVDGALITLEVSRKRGIDLDFSVCAPGSSSCDGPFTQGAVTGTVFGAKLTAAATETPYTDWVMLEFNADGGMWRLELFGVDTTPLDTNGDGQIDGYSIEDAGTGRPASLFKILSPGRQRKPRAEWRGDFVMPFTASVRLN
jgi:hypothetical protein